MKNFAYRKIYIYRLNLVARKKSIFYISREFFCKFKCKFKRNFEQKSKFDSFLMLENRQNENFSFPTSNFIISYSDLWVFIWKNIVRNVKFDCEQEHLHFFNKKILLNFHFLLFSGWRGHFSNFNGHFRFLWNNFTFCPLFFRARI